MSTPKKNIVSENQKIKQTPAWMFIILTIVLFFLTQIIGTIVTMVLDQSSYIGFAFSITMTLVTITPLFFISKSFSISNLLTTFRIKTKVDIHNYAYIALGILGLLALNLAITVTSYQVLPETLQKKFEYLYNLSNDTYFQLFYTGMNWKIIIPIISVAIFPPIYEELLYRGFLQKNLEQRISPKSAIIITSFIFSIVHVNITATISLFLIALYLGYIAYRTDSMRLLVFGHGLNNLISILLMNYQGRIPIEEELGFPPSVIIILYLVGLTLIILSLIYISRNVQNRSQK